MQMDGFDPMTCRLLSVFPNHSAVRASNTNIYGPLYFRFSHKRGEGGVWAYVKFSHKKDQSFILTGSQNTIQ